MKIIADNPLEKLLEISGICINQDIIIFPVDENCSLNNLKSVFGEEISIEEIYRFNKRGFIVHNASFVLNNTKCMNWTINMIMENK